HKLTVDEAIEELLSCVDLNSYYVSPKKLYFAKEVIKRTTLNYSTLHESWHDPVFMVELLKEETSSSLIKTLAETIIHHKFHLLPKDQNQGTESGISKLVRSEKLGHHLQEKQYYKKYHQKIFNIHLQFKLYFTKQNQGTLNLSGLYIDDQLLKTLVSHILIENQITNINISHNDLTDESI